MTSFPELRCSVVMDGKRRPASLYATREAVEAFLEAHLFDDEVVITDSSDALVFRALDGVDVYSRLDEFGIDLPALYRRARVSAVKEAGEPDGDREPWEDLYDSIGLSPAEVAMRQRVKQLAKDAVTVADVVELLGHTYFTAWFDSEDGTRTWRFEAANRTIQEQLADGTEARPSSIAADVRVRHSGSGEDIHGFVLLDPPDD